MNEDFCSSCCTQHPPPEGCPGELRSTGPEQHGWAVAVDAPRGVELLGVIVAPSGSRWRSRIVTYPQSPWTLPLGRGMLKFVGDTAEEAEAKGLDFVLHWCADHGRRPRDGFGPWDRIGGPDSRRPPPRKRRSHTIRYGSPGAMVLANTRDLSAGGMFVATTKPEPPGTILDLEMEIYGCIARMRGTGVWVRERLEPGRPRGMGIQLLDPPPVYKLFVWGLG